MGPEEGSRAGGSPEVEAELGVGGFLEEGTLKLGFEGCIGV